MNHDPNRCFIGRERELDALRRALAQAESGQPNIFLLAGEPGIGKTSTAQEITRQARQQGVIAVWGRCPEDPGVPPYWPWLQLIGRYLAEVGPQELEQVVGSARQQLHSLDPALLGELAAPPEAAEADSPAGQDKATEPDAAKARFRLFDAIAGFWRRASSAQPLLLVIDDLHQADVASLRLLEFVLAEAGDCRLMIVGTYRDAVVVRQHPLTDTLAELHRSVTVQRQLLGGFTPQETALFLATATASAELASTELASTLHDQTDGHPLFLAELARDFRQADGRNGRDGQPPADHWRNVLRRSRGVRGVIGARLNRLSAPCLRTLQHAAVFGRDFHFDLLRQTLDDLSEDEALAAIDEALAACLVVETEDAASYQFVHALVRDALYEELPTAQRARLHRQIGAAYEQHYRGDLSGCLAALAHHYHAAGAAGDPEKAIAYATRAAERATGMLAHEEACLYYERACADLPPGTVANARRCPLLLALGDAQNSAGASSQALSTFTDAAECARQLHDAGLLARAAIGFSEAQWRLGIEGSPAAVLIREALAVLAPTDLHERTALYTALCRALIFSNLPDDAERAFREAVALAHELGEPLALFRAMCAILPGRWFPERLALRIETAQAAIEIAGRAGHPDWVAPYLSGWHTGDLMEAGDTAGARTTAEFHLVTGETRREPFNEAVALAALAMIATHEGRFADAETLAKRAFKCGSRFDRANAAGIFSVQMFTLWRHQGRLRELAPVFRQFLAHGTPGAAWRPGMAIMYGELGAWDDTRQLFASLSVGGFSGIGNDAIRIASLAYLAEVCVWLGDEAQAATLYRLMLPYAGRNIVFGAHTASFGAADRLLGMLAALGGHRAQAARHFEQAIAMDTRSGGRPWLAQSRYEFAGLLRTGTSPAERERADALLQAALAEARQLGMRGLEEAIEARMRPAPDAAPATCAGLSPREVQILRLIAAGKTNQQIAGALCRSPNTVANHVRNILGKTQAANRTEASAFAVRHGLVTAGRSAPSAPDASTGEAGR